MNGMALLGILLLVYGVVVIGFTLKKPESMWQMKKIQLFIKVLGEKGTDIFFYIFGVICVAGGIILLTQ